MRRELREMKRIVEEQERSGASVPEYCAQNGLETKRFYVWRQRVRQESAERFARVESWSGEVSLKLSDSVTLRVKEEDLGKVLKELIECVR